MAVTWPECLAAFVAGMLAATPFIWAFIFKTAKNLEIFCTWQSQIYYYSPLYLQICIMIAAVIKFYGKEMKIIKIAVPTAGVLTVATLCASSSLINEADILTCIFFLLNVFCLSAIFPISYGVALMCCQLIQSYFSSGMLAALLVYYGILFFRVFGALGAFVPFCFFLGFGVVSLEYLKRAGCFKDGLFSCRAIYVIDSERYVTHGFGQVLKKTWRELLIVFVLTTAIVSITLCMATHTEVMFGLSQFSYLFQIGIFFCDIAIDSYIAMVVAVIIMISSATILFCVQLSPVISCIALVLMYMAYFSAQNSTLRIIRRNLSKGINQPVISIIVGSICNLALTIVFLILNKCQI